MDSSKENFNRDENAPQNQGWKKFKEQ